MSMPAFPKKSVVLLMCLKAEQVLACFTKLDRQGLEEVCLFLPSILPLSDILVLR